MWPWSDLCPWAKWTEISNSLYSVRWVQIKLVNTCEIQIAFLICALSLSLFISVVFAQFDKSLSDQFFKNLSYFQNFILFCLIMACCACSVVQLCPTLCDPMNCKPPGSSAHEIFQARILGWVAISSFRGTSWPSDPTHISCIAGRFLLLFLYNFSVYLS